MSCINDLAALDLIDPNLLGGMTLHRDGATVEVKATPSGMRPVGSRCFTSNP